MIIQSMYVNYNTTLQLFHKKEIVQGFLMYNEFDQNITKESDPVRQTHYTTKIIFGVDFLENLWIYFHKQSSQQRNCLLCS